MLQSWVKEFRVLKAWPGKAALLLLLGSCLNTAGAEPASYRVDGCILTLDESFERVGDDRVSVFRSADGIVVIAGESPGLSQQNAAEYLKQGYQDDTLAIAATSTPKDISVQQGKGVSADIEGIYQRKPVQGKAAMLFGDQGQAVAVLVAGDKKQADNLQSRVSEIISGIRFEKQEASYTAEDWRHVLPGLKLTRRDLKGGAVSYEDIHFCRNGRFKQVRKHETYGRDSNTTMFSESRKQKQGDWDVVTDSGISKLLLDFGGRHVEMFAIEDKYGQTLLDGERYYMLPSDYCH